MRPATLFVFAIVIFYNGYAQHVNEIQTKVIALDQLITFAADQSPQQDPQQLLFLFETHTPQIAREASFYMEQGFLLVLKRLNPTDRIAIATYGQRNGIVMRYTAVAELLDQPLTIFKKDNDLSSDRDDGIRAAYHYADQELGSGFRSCVLMINNNVSAKPAQIVGLEASHSSSASADPKAIAPAKGKIGGAIALTALSILPEILQVIKN